jgi:S-DNA-T family DNA segregation ATPase FtsK/SpoIIIE
MRSVRVERDPNNASRCVLTLIKRDHFGRGAIPCPWLDVGQTSVWNSVAIGDDELGHAVEVTLAASQVLIGGVPNSGKSNLLQLVAASCALDPSASVWVLDPKEVELARWKVLAAGSAGADIGVAVGILKQLCDEMTRRYELLAWRGARRVRPEDGLGLHVVLIDEVGIYLGNPDTKAVTEFASLLRKLVTLGRAAGISTVIATQRPATDVLPSSIRDNIASLRIAFRCATRESSDIVLGTGWAANGFVATDIDSGQSGVCYLLSEGGAPVKLRCYSLTDEDLDAVVERARQLRR